MGLTLGLTRPPGGNVRLQGAQPPSLGILCATGMPVVRGGQTVPSQAPLCFDPGSPASDRTEGKKKGRPKAENQALRDIPVSSLRAGVGLMLGSASACLPHTQHQALSLCYGRSVFLGLRVLPRAYGTTSVGLLGAAQSTATAQGGLHPAVVPRLKGSCSWSVL